MSGAFIAGVFAGYGVAIPVGAIAVLILDAAIRHGFRIGMAAGAGAATADAVYAALAALAGAAIAALIDPVQTELRVLAVVILVLIAARGLLAVRSRAAASDDGPPPPSDVRRTYLRFLGLTIVNPMTVVYFAALIVGLPAIGDAASERAAFVVGAALASLSWQTLLASIGSFAHGRLSPRARLVTSLVGNLIVLAFAANIARGIAFG
ncbi:MAG: LysE family transporter [Candidatus Limnocylindrales bacterium]